VYHVADDPRAIGSRKRVVEGADADVAGGVVEHVMVKGLKSGATEC